MTDLAADSALGVRRRRLDVRLLIERLGPLAALVLLVAIAATSQKYFTGSTTFLKPENFRDILQNNAFVGIVALGMTFVIIAGGIDLSVGSLVALAAGAGYWLMSTAYQPGRILDDVQMYKDMQQQAPYGGLRIALAQWFLQHHWDGNTGRALALAAIGCLAVGTFGGLLNGVLVAKGRIAPFIVTLGGFAAYRSLVLAMADGGTLTLLDSGANSPLEPLAWRGVTLPAGGGSLLIQYPILCLLALTILLVILLNRTRFGRYVIAIGSNERAAIYSAINVDRVKILTYTLLGAMCGLAALLASAWWNSVPSGSAAAGYELDAIAAVAIGGTRMSGGSGSVVGTLIGVLILGVINNMLTFLGVSSHLQGLVKGIIVVTAVLLQRIGRSSR